MKIRVFRLRAYRVDRGNINFGCADYLYSVYLFGILVHSLTLTGIDYETAKLMFGKRYPDESM